MMIQLPTWQTVRRSPQVRQLLHILQLLLQHILAFLNKLKVPQYAGAAVDYVTHHIRSLGNALYNEIPPMPEFPPEYRELLLLPQKLAELPQHIPDYMYPSFWKAVYDDLPPLPDFVYPSWWRELYNGLPGWLFPSYYRNLALDAILKIWSIYIGFLATRDTSRDIQDSPQELYDTLSQTRDAVVELLQEDALPPKQVSQAPQTEVLMEEEEYEPEQQPQEEEAGVWSVESAIGGKGLSRYAGVESLVELSDGAAPIVPPVQTRPRHSMVLSSIPDTTEEPRQPLPPLDEPEKPDISTTEDEFEDVSESSSKDKEGIWASLVSKYAEPDKPKKEKSRELSDEDLDDGPEYVGTADEIVKRYTSKSAVSLDLDEDEDDGRPMTDDDFTKVGLRLEEYLSRLDDDEDVPSGVSKVKANKVKKSKVKVAKESITVSLKKEKPQEKVESMEEELMPEDDTEREPTMEDIEAELRRLEEMEAEIALMEQKENETLSSEDAESIAAGETDVIRKAEISYKKLTTEEMYENLQPTTTETIQESVELNLISDENLIIEHSEEKIRLDVSEKVIISEKSSKILESEGLIQNFVAEIPKDTIKSETSEEFIQSEKTNDKLEDGLSEDKLASEFSEEITESGKLEEHLESHPSEDKLEEEVPIVIQLEKSEDELQSQPSEDKLASQQSVENLVSEASEDRLESAESADKLESEASADKLESEASADKLELQVSEEIYESQVSEDKLESQVSEDKLWSQASDDMLESQGSEDKLESQISDEAKLMSQASDDLLESELSEGMMESEKSDEKIESEESVEYSETTESESEPITQLQGEKITIELSASVTDSGSIRGFFTNLWNRADNQQMVEKTFEKTLASETKQTTQNEDIETDINTGENESEEAEIDSSENTADPASIKDFFQSLWTRADNHVNLEKGKESVSLEKEEVEKVKEIITEENLINNTESKTLLETDLDEIYEEEPEVSVEVIVKPEDKPVPKSILKKPSVDLSMNAQEKTFEMKVEELKAEMGEKTSKTLPVPAEEKTFEMKVNELKADMMDQSSFKMPFMEELDKEKTFKMKIEALKSQMEEVEIEVKGNKDKQILTESESKWDLPEVLPVQEESIIPKLDEVVPENICEEESKVIIEPVQSEPEQSNVEISDEFNKIQTAVYIETDLDKEALTAVSESDNTGVSMVDVVESTVIQPYNDINNVAAEKAESDIKAEIHAAMEEVEESEVKVDSVDKDTPTSDIDRDNIQDELKQGMKESDTSKSSSKRPPVAAWRGTWSQATLDDIGDFETEAIIDDSIRDLSKRKGSTISDSGSVKGFFENLWKCAEVEGVKTKSSLDSKSRSESMDAGSLLESSNDNKEAETSIDMPEKQTEISQNGNIHEIASYLISQETTQEEVTAAAVMTEFWGRRIEESDDEDVFIKENVLAEEIIPETDFWNRKILEDSSVEKETSAPIENFLGTINKTSNEGNEELTRETSYSPSEVEKMTASQEYAEMEVEFTKKEEIELKANVSTEEITSVTDFWNRKILEDSSVEKETSAPIENFRGTINKTSNEGNEELTRETSYSPSEMERLKTSQEYTEMEVELTKKEEIELKANVSTEEMTPVTDFWNRNILEDSSVEKETPAPQEGSWGAIDKISKEGEEVLTSVTDFWGSEMKNLKSTPEHSDIQTGPSKDDTIELTPKVSTEEITHVSNLWYTNQQEDSSVEKDDLAPGDGFWYTIDKPSNENDKVMSSITDYWGSKTEKTNNSQGHSDIQDGLTKGEEMELKDYLEQNNGCETDTGSMDIGSLKELDKTIGKYSPMTVSSIEKDDSIPKHLEEVEDLLVPARPARRNKKSSPVNVDDDVDIPETDRYMRKYMEMPANLTEDEEMELREYMAQHQDESEELSLERYLEMNPDLTEEEKADYEELLMERQTMRDREHKDLEKYLDMPVGLTEEEKQELEMLEKEEGDEGEEWSEAANFRELLDMPADLTEEELRILQEDQGDEEMEFEDEDAYRQYIRQRYLMQLDEEAYAAYDDDEGGYGYETEYEGDAEYDDEYDEEMEGEYVMVQEDEDAAVSEQQKDSMVDGSVNTDSVFKKTKRIFGFKKSSKENSVEGSPSVAKKFGIKKGSSEEKSREESPGASKKKVGFLNLATKDTSEEGSPAPAKKKFGFPKLVTKESNESSSPAAQKKFFRFGSLGTKKKKGTSNESLEKTEIENSFTVGVCTIERDLHDMTECFSDLYSIDNLKKESLKNIMDGKNKDIIENGPNAELCKSLSESLSNLIFKEKAKSIHSIDSSLLSTSRIKHECEIPEVFLYSPPAGDTKDQREVISPGEEDFDFWHQWQSEEKATVRLSNEWVDDLDVIEEESEVGEYLDIIYEESEEEFNLEDIGRRNSDSEGQQVDKEVIPSNNESKPNNLKCNIDNVESDNESEKNVKNYKHGQNYIEENQFLATDFVTKTSKLDSNLLTAIEPPVKDQYIVKSIIRENSEEEINKGLERISEEIYELTEDNENYDWWGHINCSENETSNSDGLMNISVKNKIAPTQISNETLEIKVNEVRDSVGDEIECDERQIESMIQDDTPSEPGTETDNRPIKSSINANIKITDPIINIHSRIIEPGLEPDIVMESLENREQLRTNVIPRIEITEPEDNIVCDISYLDNNVNYEYDKVVEPLPVNDNSAYPSPITHEVECVYENDTNNRKMIDPFSFHENCNKSFSTKHEEEFDNKDDIRTVIDVASDEDSDSEESEAIGYLPLEEERDSMGFEVNVNIKEEQTGGKEVVNVETSDSEEEIAPVVEIRIIDEENTLQCFDNEQIEGNSEIYMNINYTEEESSPVAKNNAPKEGEGLECLANEQVQGNSEIFEEIENPEDECTPAIINYPAEEGELLECLTNVKVRENSVIIIERKDSKEERSVICIERKDSEEEITPAVENNTIEENELLECLDNEPVNANSVIYIERKDSEEESIPTVKTNTDEEVLECLDTEQVNGNDFMCLEINNSEEESTPSTKNEINVDREVAKCLDNVQVEGKSVICIERSDSEGESILDLKNRTVEEEEDILQCLDNKIDTLITKIKTVHKVNIDTSELVLCKNIVNNYLISELCGDSVAYNEGYSSNEVGTDSGLGSVVECVGSLSLSSPRTNNSSNSSSNSSSQHILNPGDTLLEASACGAAMADVDDSVETRMEVDEGVEDAEEVEVQEDKAADKKEDDDVIGKYVDKQEKMDEEGFNFNKDDDDDDDELPDFESKPKKKSSKPSKENGVDDEGKKKKKRRKAPDGKKKRSSKTGEEREKGGMKATYQSDDILAKHVGPRVRSFDANKIQKKFDKPKASTQLSNDCKMCGKQVYQMEKIVAEKASWHKNCFKCKECDKHLTLETYQSHEGNLFCKPHFKELFQPKAVVEDETVARAERLKRRPRMIVLENNPDELPEDVVRSTDKPDYGLEELSSANVKQKFSMFENKAKEKDTRSLEPAHVRRSQSLMNKAARFLKGDEEDSEGEYGVENSRLGEFDEDDDEDEEEEEEEEEESEYEEIEVTDEEAEEEEEIKVNGTKENGQHEEDNEDEEKDDEEKDDEEKDDEEKDEEENEDKDEVKENGIDEEDSKPKKKIKKIIKVKKEKPKKEKKEKRSRRERPASIAGAQAGELKSQWESKNRRDRMRECRSKELSKFRQMLCAGKNTNLKEMFESGKIDNCDSDDERTSRKEQIKIERTHNASRSIKDRFEKGEAYGGADSDEDRNGTDERRECEEIFREAETARAARKRFNQIDSKVKGEGRDIMRSQSFANAPITNRRISQDGGPVDTEIIRSCDIKEDFEIDNTDLASRFKFFTNYEDTENQKVEDKRRSRSFRFTPPKDGVVKVDEEKELMARMPKACMAINCPVCRSRGLEPEAVDFGRDPNLIKSTDKFDDNIDCARTKTLLNMFKKMEMQGSDDDEQGPPPPRRFTPPPEGEEYDSEEYSDEEYTDDDEDDYTDDEEDDEEEDENGVKVPKYKDEVLEMLSARKAANLRAKFEKWENGKNDVNKGSDEEGEEAMPSIDTARNLRKMFENKATEQPVPVNKPKHKVNRFV